MKFAKFHSTNSRTSAINPLQISGISDNGNYRKVYVNASNLPFEVVETVNEVLEIIDKTMNTME